MSTEVSGVQDSQVDSDVSQDGESSEDGQQGLAAVATPEQVRKMTKQLKLKFNGREITEELPFEIDEANQDWYVKQRQKAMLADHKSQEFSQLEREVGAFIQELRKNPKKALSNPAIGVDIKELTAQVLQEEIERSQKSPEQLAREELEAKYAQLLEEREKEKQELSQKELERMTEREYERYDTLMSSALEKSDLPKSPYIVKKMTEYMMLGIENNIDVTPDQIIPIIRQEMQQDLQEMFAVMPAEVIEQIVGKQNLDKLRKNRVAASKPPVPVKSAIKDVAGKKTVTKETVKQQTMKDFFGI
jgi:hypothetical protein